MIQATKDRYRNKGAYIILQAPDFSDPQFRSFEAVTPRPKVSLLHHSCNEQLVLFCCLFSYSFLLKRAGESVL